MDSPIASRPFRDEDDWWHIRELLIDLYPLVPEGGVWDVRRWDGRRFHREDPWNLEDLERCRLWVTEEGHLVAAANAEGGWPDVHLQVHPGHRYLEGEMLDWAIEELARAEDGVRRLRHMAFDDDEQRVDLLEERGFERLESREVIRRLPLLGISVPEAQAADGYALRQTSDDPSDHQLMADLLNAAFRRTIHSAREYEIFATRSPSFRHDLNLIASAPDGSFAAHVGFTLDEANRCGIVEPVCTHPDHRRHGLALALINEGLGRLQAAGAEVATVGTGGEEGPNRFYEAAGFVEPRWGHIWRWESDRS